MTRLVTPGGVRFARVPPMYAVAAGDDLVGARVSVYSARGSNVNEIRVRILVELRPAVRATEKTK